MNSILNIYNFFIHNLKNNGNNYKLILLYENELLFKIIGSDLNISCSIECTEKNAIDLINSIRTNFILEHLNIKKYQIMLPDVSQYSFALYHNKNHNFDLYVVIKNEKRLIKN